MAVLCLVLSVKPFQDRRQRRRGYFPRRKVDAQLVALTDVAQVAAAHEPDVRGIDAVGPELVRQLRLHRRQIGIQPREIDFAAHLELGTYGVVLEIRGEQAHRGGDARVAGHDHLRRPELGRDVHRVQGTGSAERDEGVLARIDSLLHGA